MGERHEVAIADLVEADLGSVDLGGEAAWAFGDKRRVDRIALDISGGREAGYRAWTHKRNFPAQPAGRWRVRVVTEAGQMIGMLRFRVTE